MKTGERAATIGFFVPGLQENIDMQPYKAVLPEIARRSIELALQGLPFPATEHEALLQRYPQLGEQRATFVTLTRHGRLRGCIGSILPRRPLMTT